MEEAIVGGIIATITGELASSRIIKESSRLPRVKEDLVWIETEMRHIRSYLEDAEAKQFRTKGLSNFIRDIWDLAYDVEDIIDTYFPKIGLSRSRWKRHLDFSNMRIAHGFVKEVEGIRKRAEDIKNARQTFGIDESRRSCEEDPWDHRRSFPHLDEPNVVGFDNLIKSLVNKVLDKDLHHRVVSIIGFPGLGKTTLAKKVYHSARKSKVYKLVRRQFYCAAWICVSERPNVKKLLEDIAGQVGLKKEKIEHNVEINLSKFLSTKRTQLTTDPTEALKKLEKLKFLKLSFDSYLGKKLVCSGDPGNFPQLEVLEMECLPNLEMVVVEEGGMPRLRDFRILHCSTETRIPHRVRNVMSIIKPIRRN